MTINITVPALSPKSLGLLACLAAMAISAIASAAEPVKTCTEKAKVQADGSIAIKTTCTITNGK